MARRYAILAPLGLVYVYPTNLQTYSTVLTFIMAMALYPEKQREAQAELDEVVGTERMPKISDKVSLPYVNALIKETMRWHPALPLSTLRSLPGAERCRPSHPVSYRHCSLHFRRRRVRGVHHPEGDDRHAQCLVRRPSLVGLSRALTRMLCQGARFLEAWAIRPRGFRPRTVPRDD